MDDTITPFTIHVSDDVLDNLKRRLRATRWPEPEPVDDWSQGVPLALGLAHQFVVGPGKNALEAI